MKKSWHIDRRTFLRSVGATLALPFFESMSLGASPKALPRRVCSVFFPFGVSLPPADHELKEWHWFPSGEGCDFQLSRTHASLESLCDDLTFIGGLSHPNGRKMGGHDTGDIFLTGAKFGSDYKNLVSMDQLAAMQIGGETRFPSLTLSSDGGVGQPTRSRTLSFSREGRPIPALSAPRQVFDRLFGQSDQATAQQLKNSGSMLDLLLEQSKSLERRLGKRDQEKFDEYLTAVRSVEQSVERSQDWLGIPKPNVDPESISLDASPEGPEEYIRTMYDLMFLAFQTDSARVATYMLGQVSGATSIANKFPSYLGLAGNWHGLAHDVDKKDGYEQLGRFDQFLSQQFSRFLNRLKITSEGGESLLDRTLVLYGSSNSNTHQNINYPLILAGGKKLGLRHGQYLRYGDDTPMSNLLLTMLQQLDAPLESFSDSTGTLSELLG